MVGNTFTMTFQGLPLCTEYMLNKTDLPSDPSACEVVQRIDFDWNTSLNTIGFDVVDFSARYNTTLPLTEIRDNTICPDNSCITISQLAPTVYEVACKIKNKTLTKNQAGFKVVFSGLDGCVGEYWVNKCEVDDVFAATPCAPQLNPPVTFLSPASPAKCISRIAGTVTYHFKSCDLFNIVALPANGSAGATCTRSEALIDENISYYGFCACRDQFPYTLTCSTPDNNDQLCGVTTYDLVLISRHILNVQPFNNEGQFIAADANCSGSITNFDIVQLQKLILGVYEELPNSVPSFKIYSDQFVIPWSSLEFCKPFDDKLVSAPSENNNFNVVKTGDVNKNCEKGGISCLTGNGGDDRDRSKIVFTTNHQGLETGGYYLLPIIADRKVEAVAMQCELEYNPEEIMLLEFTEGDFSEIKTEHFSNPSTGFIRIAWHSENGEPILIEEGKVIGYVRIKALAPITQDIFTVRYRNDKGIQPVLYMQDGTEWEIINRFDVTQTALTILEAEISPNPTEGSCLLNITAPTKDRCTIKVYSNLGIPIAERQTDLTAGMNSFVLSTELSTQPAGIYIVEINTGGMSKVLRLVKQ